MKIVALEASNIKRSTVNRQLKAVEATLAAAPQHADAPTAEVSVEQLAGELERRQAANRQNDSERRAHESAQEAYRRQSLTAADAEAEIKELERRLEEAKAKFARLRAECDAQGEQILTQRHRLNSLRDADEDEVRERLRTAEAVNRRVRENQARAKLREQRDALAAEARRLTAELDEWPPKKK